MKPVKIFELKGDNWRAGMSLQSASAVGGLFSSTTNFDPFEITGMMQCSLAAVTASDLSITNTPTALTLWQTSGTSKLYSHSSTKLYEVLDGSPYTTVDRTSQISVSNPFRGAIIYQGKYIYAQDVEIHSNTLPVASGSDVTVMNSGFANSSAWRPFCVGADTKLYFGDGSRVHQLVSTTTLNNSGANKVALEDGMTVRDLINDGRYLVILADNNNSSFTGVPTSGRFRCQVLFWDMVKGTFDQIYEFTDSYLVGGKFLDSGIYVFGGDNIYVCNIATQPKAIFSFKTGSTITEKPQNSFQLTQAKNSIYWCGQSNGSIYAYGSLFPGMKKVFYQPLTTNYTPSTITNNGTNFYVGTSGTDNFLQVTGTGSTRNTGSVFTAPIILPQPYKFDYVKVTLQQPLTSGQSITVGVTSQSGNEEVYGNTTLNYSTTSGKQTLIFDKSVGGTHSSTSEYFEDFQLLISSPRAVARVELWATPQYEHSQVL